MSKTIYPLIFFSISEKGSELRNSIAVYSKLLKEPDFERFIRDVTFQSNGTLTTNKEQIKYDFTSNPPIKQNNYKQVNDNLDKFKSVFDGQINDICTIENNNYASEHGYILGKPQIIILGSIETAELSSFLFPLIKIVSSLPQNPDLQVLLHYQQASINLKEESGVLRNSFFRELAIEVKDKIPFVWLIDVINENEINLGSNSMVDYAIAQFIDLMLLDAAGINSSVYNTGDEQEKPCMFLSFGYSILKFPSQQIREYLNIHSVERELDSLIRTFDRKFEIILMKDEINKYLRDSGIKELPERLTKNDDAISIYKDFNFDAKSYGIVEHAEVLSKKLSKIIEPSNLPHSSSNNFFQSIEFSEKEFCKVTIEDISLMLDNAKKRELKLFTEFLSNAIKNQLDSEGKGINFSLLFLAILTNNTGAIEPFLDGRFTSEVTSLTIIQDEFRSKFIGTQITEKESKLREVSDKLSNNLKVIDQYTNQINTILESLLKLEESVGTENANYIELYAKKESLIEAISNFRAENEKLRINISDITFEIGRIKTEFDKDATKESFKKVRNEKNKAEIVNIKTEGIRAIDEQLAIKYGEKNQKITERSKFIFKNLKLIPIALLAILGMIFFLTFKYAGLGNTGILYFALIIVGIMLIYYLVSFIQFQVLKKQFNLLIDEVESLLEKKSRLFIRYSNLINDCYKIDFLFERDLIAFNMVKHIIDAAVTDQKRLESFKKSVIDINEEISEKKSLFAFSSSSSEFCIVDKQEVETIYNRSCPRAILNSGINSIKSSDCYDDFCATGSIKTLIHSAHKEVITISQDKIETESLKSVLFNNSANFEKRVNTNAEFRKIIDTSRPLLRTNFWGNVTSDDIPIIQNILVGYNDPAYQNHLDGIKLISKNIDETNDKIFGLLSLKSNFPAYMIYDVEENERYYRKVINRKNLAQYFIQDEVFTISLFPSSAKLTRDAKGNILLGNELIVAITKGYMMFDATKNKFTSPAIGDLGINFDDLALNWNSPICYGLFEKAKLNVDEIYNSSEEVMHSIRNEFKETWTSIPLIISDSIEKELSEYYFSIKGKVKDWEIIKKTFANNRK